MSDDIKSSMLTGLIAFLCIAAGLVTIIAAIYSDLFKLYDIFYILLFVVCLEVCLLMSLYIGFTERNRRKGDALLETAYCLKAVWLKSTIIWTLVNYWMVSSSLLATVIVIYISSESDNMIDTSRIIFYSIASLFLSVMNYALTPMAMARGYRKAFLEINKAILEYRSQSSKSEQMLADKISEGEEIIDMYTFEMKV